MAVKVGGNPAERFVDENFDFGFSSPARSGSEESYAAEPHLCQEFAASNAHHRPYSVARKLAETGEASISIISSCSSSGRASASLRGLPSQRISRSAML